MKWNMGWMHDTLGYMALDPIHRYYHHDALTFGLLYAFSENFLLPFSHDEVVHQKGSMLQKMPGDRWQQFANLRLLYTYMFTYPGKKLLFMGQEFGVEAEWDCRAELDWALFGDPLCRGLRQLVSDLAHAHRDTAALHRRDFAQDGFQWVDCHDSSQSVLCFLRRDGDDHLLTVLNFTPVPRNCYRVGVPSKTLYTEFINSDSSHYGGSNVGNSGGVVAQPTPWMGQPYSVELNLPPLGGLVLRPR